MPPAQSQKRSPEDPGQSDTSPGKQADAASSSSTKRTRSRNGCLVCRARRIKCDLERPECKRCVNYGAECVYPVKKAFNAAAVDAALGSRHNRPSNVAATAAAYHGEGTPGPEHSPPLPPSSHSGPVQLHPPIGAFAGHNDYDTLYRQDAHGGGHGHGSHGGEAARREPRPIIDSVQPMDLVYALFRKTKMGSFFNNPVDPPEFLSLAFPEPEDLRCFHHCLTYSLSLLVIDEDNNPWVEHIAPMFLFPTGEAPLSVNALKHCFLAIGATHLAFLEATSRSDAAERTLEQSRNYRTTALNLLRQARRVPGELGHDAFLAASLMITDNDILAGSMSWREPLRYAKASIAHRGGAGSVLFGSHWRQTLARSVGSLIPPPSARRYLIEHGVMHDILSCFATGAAPSVLDADSGWWEALGTTGSTDREWESVESLVGFDRPLVRITSTVLTLYNDWRRFEAHYRPLTELDPAVSLHSPAALERMDLGRRLGDVQMELATWRAEAPARYMSPRTMIGSMTLWHSVQIIMLHDMQKRGRDDADVQSSAAAILELCIEVGDKVEFLNWSLLIGCSVILDPDKRNAARNVIRTFAVQCCHELEATRVIIEEMWRRMDAGYDDEACNWREVAIEIGRPVLIG